LGVNLAYTIIANAPYNEGVSAIIFDSITDINENFKNTISSYPVESKETKSDNVTRNNPEISLTGIVQNAPPPNTNGNISSDNLINSGEDRRAKARSLLKAISDGGQFFTLVCKFETYTNCLISALTFPTTPETSSQLVFTMDLQVTRATSVQTTTLSVSKVAGTLSDDVAGANNTGNNNKKEVSPTVLLDAAIFGAKTFGIELPNLPDSLTPEAP